MVRLIQTEITPPAPAEAAPEYPDLFDKGAPTGKAKTLMQDILKALERRTVQLTYYDIHLLLKKKGIELCPMKVKFLCGILAAQGKVEDQ